MGKLGYSKKLFGEFLAFARENKAYWIIPLLLVLALATALVLTSSAAAPFVYTLF